MAKMFPPDSIQELLFEKIIQQHSQKSDALDNIRKLLSIGKDALYRRLRGETGLSPDELRILALHYNISIDELIFQNTSNAFVSYNAFEGETQTFLEFTSNLNGMLRQVSEQSKGELLNASDEMPIFQLMRFPKLFAFKLYVWGVNTWQFNHLQKIPFKTNLVSPEVLKIAKENVKLYESLDTIELWDLGVMEKTLNQIETCALVDQFANPKDALVLCDQLSELFQHLRKEAKAGYKFPIRKSSKRGEFHLYNNEMSSTGNTFLIKSAQTKYLVFAYCPPNFFRSHDRRLCDYTEEWFENIITRSTAISGAGARSRNQYFNRLEKKIAKMKERIEMIIEGEDDI